MKHIILVPVLGLTMLAAGCAHNANRRLDEKVSQETAVKSPADVGAQAAELINSSMDLSDDQKARLLALRGLMRARNEALVAESMKLRSVLVKDVMSPKYDAKEVALIKKRITKVENDRLSVLFDAVEEANLILGRKAVSNQNIVRGFADFHGGRFD